MFIPMAAMVLVGLGTGDALAENCIPPSFYTSLPRDREWNYGVAKDPDTDKARIQAIKNLGKQVSGDIENWDDASVEKVAGPGKDRWEVAREVGKLLPQSTLLAGWEQDDFERCNGQSYVLVRIQKERIDKFIRENRKFKNDLIAGLTQRVDRVEKDVTKLQAVSVEQGRAVEENVKKISALNRRVETLINAIASLPKDYAGRASLQIKINAIKSNVASGKHSADVERQLSEAEGELEKVKTRLRELDAQHAKINSEIGDEELTALGDVARRNKIGAASISEILNGCAGAIVSHRHLKERHAFCHEAIPVVDPKLAAAHPMNTVSFQEEYLANYAVTYADLMHDNQEIIKDAEFFMKTFPKSDSYAHARELMERAIAASAKKIKAARK